jgi:peptidoglycan/LPS O-acetylase OafA/YrhL
MKLQKLESLRGMAAIYVMLYHVLKEPCGKYKIFFLLSFAQEMVILFFVLSGFVIYYSSTKTKNDCLQNFAVRRFRRIYPLFIVSLVVSYIFCCISEEKIVLINFNELLGNLLMLQDSSALKPGVWFDSFLGNPALWSLSYEWWFYLIFFLIYKLIASAMISLFGYITYFTYPNKISLTLMYFLIWWSGVELAREYLKNKLITFYGQRILLISLTLMCMLLLLQVLIYRGRIGVGIHPFLEFRHFFADVIIILVGIFWQNISFLGFQYTIGWLSILAPISYGIYIIHYPIMVSFNLFGKGILSFVVSLSLTLIIAYIFEVRIQSGINGISTKFMKKT